MIDCFIKFVKNKGVKKYGDDDFHCFGFGWLKNAV
jgi:hypothetical protein